MNVRFKDGTEKSCTAPMEQKMFKGNEACGWLAAFVINGVHTSADVDKLLSEENISEITFLPDDETKLGITLSGYSKVSSAVIRHSAEGDNARVEIQLTKGV